MVPGLRACGASSLVSYTVLVVATRTSGLSSTFRISLYSLVLAIATASAFRLIVRTRHKPEVDSKDARTALYFACAYGVISALALPIASRDFWYYIAAGRMAASGGDVFVQTLTESSIEGLPLRPGFYTQVTMAYGPAWVWVSSLLSAMAASSAVLEFVAYKGLMLVSWTLTLLLLYRAHRESPQAQAQAVFAFGWLPLCVVQPLVEGHNDIVMLVLATAWLVGTHRMGIWLLVGSVLVKYATVPLVALSALDAIARRSVKTVVALVLAVAAVALFIYISQGAALPAVLRITESWATLTPVALADWAARTGQVSPTAAAVAVAVWRLALGGLVVWYGRRHFQSLSRDSLAAWVTVVVLAILLGSRFILPWYVIWIMPSLLLTSDRLLLAIAWPLVVFMPFVDLIREQVSTPGRLTALLYAGVLAGWIGTFVYSKKVQAGPASLSLPLPIPAVKVDDTE
jgi:hypothetical protein